MEARKMEDFWIKMGWYKEIKGVRRLLRGKWKDPLVRSDAVKFLIEDVLCKDPKDMSAKDFHNNMLGGLLNNYYNDSPYAALVEAGYVINPWEMSSAPKGFFQDKKNRAICTKWLIQKLGKKPTEISYHDFVKEGLAELLENCNCSVYNAIKEAGYDVQPWEMSATPKGFFNRKKNRVRAMKWLVEKTGKQPQDLQSKDLKECRLFDLYSKYTIYDLVSEVWPEIKPWQMKKTPAGFFDSKENRIAAIKWLVEQTKKQPEDLTRKDFADYRLYGLLANYYSGVHQAIKEAGYDSQSPPWKLKKNFFDSKENIKAACEWLVEKLKKHPKYIIAKDFNNHGLSGLLKRYNNSPYEILIDVGLVTKDDESFMRKSGPKRYDQ